MVTFMKVDGKRTNVKGMEYTFIMMGPNTKGIGGMISRMEKE